MLARGGRRDTLLHVGRKLNAAPPSSNPAHTNMTIALVAFLVIVSLLSVLFIIRRYQAATAVQRPQIIWAACGAVALAILVGVLIGLR